MYFICSEKLEDDVEFNVIGDISELQKQAETDEKESEKTEEKKESGLCHVIYTNIHRFVGTLIFSRLIVFCC